MSTELTKAIEWEFVQLNYHWKILCQLYDSGEEGIELLNKSGSNVFQVFQKLIIDDTMLSLCRLNDPANTGKNKNASIRGLLDQLALDNEKSVKITQLLNELAAPMIHIKILRNKAMTHNDMNHATKVEVLPTVTYDDIENSISFIRQILNIITGVGGDYVPSIPSGKDGNKLLKVLAIAHSEKC